MSEVMTQYFEDDALEVPEKGLLDRTESTGTIMSRTALNETIAIEDGLVDIKTEDGEPPELLSTPFTDDPMKDYLRVIGRNPLLSAVQEVELSKSIEVGLFARERKEILIGQGVMEQSREIRELTELERIGARATDTMINSNLRLVVSIGKRYFDRGLSMLDIIQEGNMGLMRAVKKFDYTQGNKFSTYATWWIRQFIINATADPSGEIRIPVHAQELLNKMKGIQQAADEKGHILTDTEIAHEMHKTVDDVKKYKEYSRQRRLYSYNTKLGDDQESEFSDLIEDEGAIAPEVVIETYDLERVIKNIVDALPEKEANIMRLRYGLEGNEPQTLQAVADSVGLTRDHVWHIEKNIKNKLHELYSDNNSLREYLS